MTTPQQQVEIINATFEIENTRKYLAGQAEHGGDFFDKPTVHEIYQEVIDLVNYTHVLASHRSRLLRAMEELHSMLALASELPYDLHPSWPMILDKLAAAKHLAHTL
jgi:hypothetical protein